MYLCSLYFRGFPYTCPHYFIIAHCLFALSDSSSLSASWDTRPQPKVAQTLRKCPIAEHLQNWLIGRHSTLRTAPSLSMLLPSAQLPSLIKMPAHLVTQWSPVRRGLSRHLCLLRSILQSSLYQSGFGQGRAGPLTEFNWSEFDGGQNFKGWANKRQ